MEHADFPPPAIEHRSVFSALSPPTRATKAPTLERALRALGKRVEVRVS